MGVFAYSRFQRDMEMSRRSCRDVATDIGLQPKLLDQPCSKSMFRSIAGCLDPWRLIFFDLLTDVELNDVNTENGS